MNTTDDLPEWDLAGFFPEGTDINTIIKRAKEKSLEFSRVKEGLVSPELLAPAEFLKVFRKFEDIHRDIIQLDVYLELIKTESLSDNNAQNLASQIDSAINNLKNETSFFMRWWKDLPDDQAESFLHEAPGNHYYLTRKRAYNENALIEAE
ncbi:MAG: hypothetical protein LBE80_11130, partial [Deltaproteobacteria bacterium]|nr:hypothetical protein [Deltaproteobacteria bacterium]